MVLAFICASHGACSVRHTTTLRHHQSSRWATPSRVLPAPARLSRGTAARRRVAAVEEEGGASWKAPESTMTTEGGDSVVVAATDDDEEKTSGKKTRFEREKLEKDRGCGSKTSRTLLLGDVALHSAAFVFSKDKCVIVVPHCL